MNERLEIFNSVVNQMFNDDEHFMDGLPSKYVCIFTFRNIGNVEVTSINKKQLQMGLDEFSKLPRCGGVKESMKVIKNDDVVCFSNETNSILTFFCSKKGIIKHME